MSNIKYGDYRLNLAAGIPQQLTVEGDYWQIIEASAPITLEFDQGGRLNRERGSGGPGNYRIVRVLSAVDQTAVLALGRTNGMAPYDSRAVFGGTVLASLNLPTVNPSLDDLAIAAGATVMVLAADPDRVAGLVQLLEAAPGPVRIGDSTVSASRGLPLQPDDTYVSAGGPAVWVHNPNGVAVTVALQQETAP